MSIHCSSAIRTAGVETKGAGKKERTPTNATIAALPDGAMTDMRKHTPVTPSSNLMIRRHRWPNQPYIIMQGTWSGRADPC